MVAKVDEKENTLTPSTPTVTWMRVTSQDAQMMAAAAVYSIWKNYKNQAPIEVVLLDPSGAPYVDIRDNGQGNPSFTIVDQASGSES